MNIERLVAMANDISRFFAAEPDEEMGVDGIANHLKRFWTPEMRKQIVAHLAEGGEGLEPLTKKGVEKLAELDSKLRA